QDQYPFIMQGFTIRTDSPGAPIRFVFCREHAPVTSGAFAAMLPFSRTFIHARVSGQEVWTDDAPRLNIIQENASVFAEPGAVVIGPSIRARNRTANCMGIYYGEGKGLDACNIFARVLDEDMDRLGELGDSIWRNGARVIYFEALP